MISRAIFYVKSIPVNANVLKLSIAWNNENGQAYKHP